MGKKLNGDRKESPLGKYDVPPKIVRKVTGASAWDGWIKRKEDEELTILVKYDPGEHAIQVDSVVHAGDGAAVNFLSHKTLRNLDEGSAYLFANAHARAAIRKYIFDLSMFDARQMIAVAIADAARGRLGEMLYLFGLFQKRDEIPFTEEGGMLWKYRGHLEAARPIFDQKEINFMLGLVLDGLNEAPKKFAGGADEYIAAQPRVSRRPADQKVFDMVMEKIFGFDVDGWNLSFYEHMSRENKAKLHAICDGVERSRNARNPATNPILRMLHRIQIRCL